MTDRDTSYDLSDMHSLIRAGDQLGLTPVPGEDPLAFAARVADAFEDRRRRRFVNVTVRVVVSAALASFGIVSI